MSETGKLIFESVPNGDGVSFWIREVNGKVVASCEDGAVAEKIVRDVNCHDRLLAYAKELLLFKEWAYAEREDIDDIKDTIAEAEGGGNG